MHPAAAVRIARASRRWCASFRNGATCNGCAACTRTCCSISCRRSTPCGPRSCRCRSGPHCSPWSPRATRDTCAARVAPISATPCTPGRRREAPNVRPASLPRIVGRFFAPTHQQLSGASTLDVLKRALGSVPRTTLSTRFHQLPGPLTLSGARGVAVITPDALPYQSWEMVYDRYLKQTAHREVITNDLGDVPPMYKLFEEVGMTPNAHVAFGIETFPRMPSTSDTLRCCAHGSIRAHTPFARWFARRRWTRFGATRARRRRAKPSP